MSTHSQPDPANNRGQKGDQSWKIICKIVTQIQVGYQGKSLPHFKITRRPPGYSSEWKCDDI